MTSDSRTELFWKEHIEKLESIEISNARYCRENNLNYGRLCYWRKRFKKQSGFIPVQIKSINTPVPSQPLLCVLESRGHVIKIYDLAAMSLVLARVV